MRVRISYAVDSKELPSEAFRLIRRASTHAESIKSAVVDTEIDIEDDISDIAEGDVANTKDEKEDGDNEVREVKVTQTKSKRGGGKKKKTVEINL